MKQALESLTVNVLVALVVAGGFSGCGPMGAALRDTTDSINNRYGSDRTRNVLSRPSAGYRKVSHCGQCLNTETCTNETNPDGSVSTMCYGN